MSTPFATIITGNQQLDRVQQNISNALNQGSGSLVLTVNSNNYALTQIPDVLIIPTASISNGSTINVSLPDATQNGGASFIFKKTDTTSNTINFTSTSKNKQNKQQTVENSSSYSTSSSLAYGRLFSDGNNWWLG